MRKSLRHQLKSLRLPIWTLAACAAGLAYAPPAHAFLHISALGVGYLPEASSTLEGQSLSTSGTFKLGVGALLGLGFGPGELETGVLFYTRDVSASGTLKGVSFNEPLSMPVIEVPVDLRISLGMLYLKGGLYADVISGQITGSTGSESVSDAQLNPWDFGALVGAGVDIPVGPGIAITAGAQYQLQLDNSDNSAAIALDSTAETHFNALLFLAGLRIGF